jgi:hypothetical protein
VRVFVLVCEAAEVRGVDVVEGLFTTEEAARKHAESVAPDFGCNGSPEWVKDGNLAWWDAGGPNDTMFCVFGREVQS